LREASLLGAKNLTIEQLATAKTLYGTELDERLLHAIERDYPHLRELPDFESVQPRPESWRRTEKFSGKYR
jgi:hypothetical protein